jgi:hypothetical protein
MPSDHLIRGGLIVDGTARQATVLGAAGMGRLDDRLIQGPG